MSGIRDYRCRGRSLQRSRSRQQPLAEIRDRVRDHDAHADGAPDGIVSGSGAGSIALIAGLEAVGKKLNQDVDMVSKVPSDFLSWLRPEVITMNEDIRHAGRELARAVIGRIAGLPAEELQSLSQAL